MKTIFKKLGAGFFMAGCIAVAGTKAFAQDASADVCKDIEGQQASYKPFTDNIPPAAPKPTIEQTQTAIKAGDDYVQKYGACPESKDIVSYLNTNLPKMKERVAKLIAARDKGAVLTKFDAAAKGKMVADVFTSGKEILNKEADYQDVALDVNLAMVSAGFEQTLATTPVDTYNADTINYAKSAIQKIEAGKTSPNWGVWSYNFKVDATKYKDNKAYALGALNYIIGNVDYYRLGKDNPEKKKEALQYFYKSTQYEAFTKTDPTIYQAIGAWYLDQALKIDGERNAILKANGNKDTPETLAMVGMQKGYADRSIDAYARAYKLAKDNKTAKIGYADGLYTKIKDLYAFRYDNKTEGIDQYVTTVQNNPLPDPSTEITPVKVDPVTDPAPTTNTNTPPAADTTTKPATTPTTKPATTPTTKPATAPKKPVSLNDAKSSSSPNVSDTEKSNVKKPAPKKKGTR